jgi:hypothetical protein
VVVFSVNFKVHFGVVRRCKKLSRGLSWMDNFSLLDLPDTNPTLTNPEGRYRSPAFWSRVVSSKIFRFALFAR